MPHVMVPFANGKGGVGKTALACSFAAARAHEGADVILTDLNEDQRTAVAWSRVREHNGIVPKIRVQPATPRETLEMVGRCDVLVVDTPGRVDGTTLKLARHATFMVIPTGPNPTYELTPTLQLLHGLRAEGIELWRLGVVLSRLTPGQAAKEEEAFARDYLARENYSALEGYLPNAPEFGSALAQGYGLTEVEGSKPLREQAQSMMASIGKAVAGAERRIRRLRETARDEGRGGRDR